MSEDSRRSACDHEGRPASLARPTARVARCGQHPSSPATRASERRRSYMMAVPPWSATAGGASPVECDRRGNRVRKEPSYARSRHRRRRPHADRARVQGVAQGRPRRRARRRAAQGAASSAIPGSTSPQTDDVMMGAASSVGEQAYNVGRNADAAGGIDHHVPACTVNRFCASSLQTMRMAFHADQGGRGRPVHRRRRRVRLARRARRGHGRRVQARQARRLRGLALRRLHPDGPDRRERRRALQGHPRGSRTSGP